jgi:hypothetical protein
MLGNNQNISPAELAAIRVLDDFDLKMLLSEIHDHGWPAARRLLADILQAQMSRRGNA